jgi:hypothetical protein
VEDDQRAGEAGGQEGLHAPSSVGGDDQAHRRAVRSSALGRLGRCRSVVPRREVDQGDAVLRLVPAGAIVAPSGKGFGQRRGSGLAPVPYPPAGATEEGDGRGQRTVDGEGEVVALPAQVAQGGQRGPPGARSQRLTGLEQVARRPGQDPVDERQPFQERTLQRRGQDVHLGSREGRPQAQQGRAQQGGAVAQQTEAQHQDAAHGGSVFAESGEPRRQGKGQQQARQGGVVQPAQASLHGHVGAVSAHSSSAAAMVWSTETSRMQG